MKRIFILLTTLLVLSGCTKDDEGFTIYTVKAHRSACQVPERIFRPQWNKNSLDFWFKTNDTWIWSKPGEYHSHNGVAKVFRLSDGNHRKNSYGLGRKDIGGLIIVGLFVERGNQYFFNAVDTIGIDERHYVRISREPDDDGDYYVLRMSGRETRIPARDDKKFGYIGYPHMPGGYTLNHDWKVLIKQKK